MKVNSSMEQNTVVALPGILHHVVNVLYNFLQSVLCPGSLLAAR